MDKLWTKRASPGNRGSMSELRVAADLLDRGFYVYRSVSDNAPFDLIACINNKLYRIEVKTGTRDECKLVYASPTNVQFEDFDILAVWNTTDNSAYYNPEPKNWDRKFTDKNSDFKKDLGIAE